MMMKELLKCTYIQEHPGDVFNYGQKYGELIKLKVETCVNNIVKLFVEQDGLQSKRS